MQKIHSANSEIVVVTIEAISRETRVWVQDAVDSRADLPRKTAIGHVAKFFGLPARRVAAYYYGEVNNPPAWEYLAIQRKISEWMGAEIRRAEAAVALKRARWNAFDRGDHAVLHSASAADRSRGLAHDRGQRSKERC